jgi:hypothetical protein
MVESRRDIGHQRLLGRRRQQPQHPVIPRVRMWCAKGKSMLPEARSSNVTHSPTSMRNWVVPYRQTAEMEAFPLTLEEAVRLADQDRCAT